jgi:hypothetical protein
MAMFQNLHGHVDFLMAIYHVYMVIFLNSIFCLFFYSACSQLHSWYFCAATCCCYLPSVFSIGENAIRVRELCSRIPGRVSMVRTLVKHGIMQLANTPTLPLDRTSYFWQNGSILVIKPILFERRTGGCMTRWSLSMPEVAMR